MSLRKLSFFLLLILVGLPHTLLARTEAEEQLYQEVKAHLQGQGDYIFRKIKRSREREKTIELKAFISREADYKHVTQILKNHPSYRKWALKNINIKPSGDPYYVQFLDILALKEPSQIAVTFNIVIPIFNYKGTRAFQLESYSKKDIFWIEATSIPKDISIIKELKGRLTVFPAENKLNRVWICLDGYVSLHPWLLYQALPEQLLMREYTNRLEAIMQNYLAEEDRIVELEEQKKSPVISRKSR